MIINDNHDNQHHIGRHHNVAVWTFRKLAELKRLSKMHLSDVCWSNHWLRL